MTAHNKTVKSHDNCHGNRQNSRHHLPAMKGSECLCVESLLLNECGHEPLCCPGGKGSTGGEAIGPTQGDEGTHAEDLQGGNGGMETRDWGGGIHRLVSGVDE